MGNALATTTISVAYGSAEPAGTIDPNGFASQDATELWRDQGEAEAMAAAHAQEMQAYANEQVKYALLEYGEHLVFELANTGPDLIGLATFVATPEKAISRYWTMADRFKQAIAQAETNGDEAFLRSMEKFLRDVGGNFRAAPAPQPTRTARPGRAAVTRPPVAPRRPGRPGA